MFISASVMKPSSLLLNQTLLKLLRSPAFTDKVCCFVLRRKDVGHIPKPGTFCNVTFLYFVLLKYILLKINEKWVIQSSARTLCYSITESATMRRTTKPIRQLFISTYI